MLTSMNGGHRRWASFTVVPAVVAALVVLGHAFLDAGVLHEAGESAHGKQAQALGVAEEHQLPKRVQHTRPADNFAPPHSYRVLEPPKHALALQRPRSTINPLPPAGHRDCCC